MGQKREYKRQKDRKIYRKHDKVNEPQKRIIQGYI